MPCFSYTNIPFIYRICTVYQPYINRISTVVDSGSVEFNFCKHRSDQTPMPDKDYSPREA